MPYFRHRHEVSCSLKCGFGPGQKITILTENNIRDEYELAELVGGIRGIARIVRNLQHPIVPEDTELVLDLPPRSEKRRQCRYYLARQTREGSSGLIFWLHPKQVHEVLGQVFVDQPISSQEHLSQLQHLDDEVEN